MAVVVAGALLSVFTPSAFAGRPAKDRAPCEMPETGLQGQVPLGDQLSGRSQLGYRCGLELLGQESVGNRGANFQLTWYGDCAYVSTAHFPFFAADLAVGALPVDPAPPGNGIAVIDVHDPTRPSTTTILADGTDYNGWEADEVNEQRGILVVSGTGTQMAVYDVRDDCKHPRLRSITTLPGTSHGLRISADGRTAWGGFLQLWAMNLDDLDAPSVAFVENRMMHDLDLSPDGMRAYIADGDFTNLALSNDLVPAPGPGLTILDISEVSQRVPQPQVRAISELDWEGYSHTARLARIGGRPYIISSDEVGSVIHANKTGPLSPPPAGAGRIIDISDEGNPRIVSTLSLAVNDPANAASVVGDNATYTSHYSGIDNPNNTTTVFYTWYNSGLRAFDVRDPAHPREFAYYNPPARPLTTNRSIVVLGGPTLTSDSTTSEVRYRRGTGEIWFVSASNGFQVVRLTHAAGPNGLPRPRRKLPAQSPASVPAVDVTVAVTPAPSLRAYCSLLSG
jgi:hypothetical protein